ncbi:flagellar basal body-associated protein FliL [Alkalihalobacillus sp. LMS39]|uniref:flagellar basal body-associated protein FliL n=1 Tax=Alkalihalobacillus sp. LMS39 TaxID=2924032 RepID=UPI001FB28ACE|nr:flagellar basal body-associated protein FliL [Alkalihalobacillus sp. LMS39]UOE92831.1 flagellar basal body-associated protein FliL [Alkalihalobacillus sp. LMS39]
MFKNKLITIMLIIILSLTLLGVLALVLVNYFSSNSDEDHEPTIDEIVSLSYDTPEMTTNLLSNDFAKVQFRIQVDNKRALREIAKRDFQLENIIIRELSEVTSSQLSGGEAIEDLEGNLRDKINELMEEGEVVHVYTRRFIIQ